MEKKNEDNGSEQGRESDFISEKRPFDLFHGWIDEAEAKELNDPNAMSVATVDETGFPNIRMVLLKGFSEKGFVFYTNYESAKGVELLGQPCAALCFHWKSLRRQVRVRGAVVQVSDEEADAYFASRPRGSRVGAWASAQSRELESKFALEKSVAKYAAKYAVGAIPRPPHWSGFCVQPLEIEFWRDKPFRLHERVVFSRRNIENEWTVKELYP